MNVLAIEDQPVAALQLQAVLKSLGHDVELVTNGTEAWSRLMRGKYRAVVSDWRMPGIDGLDLCRMLRGRGGDYTYYILVSSTKITRESRAKALAAGVDDFLAKPVDPDELGMRLHVAERILGLTAQVKQLEAFIPICGYCKKIRDDRKYWQEVETYFAQQQGAKFSHGICPDCYERVMAPQLRKMGVDPTLPTTEEGRNEPQAGEHGRHAMTRFRSLLPGVTLVWAVWAGTPGAVAAEHSRLWGERGEAWDAAGRLPDFSRAGYREGREAIPAVAQVSNVKDFGAVGDGVADDTRAFQAAIDATARGAVWVPPGRYKITDYVRIAKSGVVLRGAGPAQSVLWFPRGLDEVHPRQGRTSTGSPASGYSFDGAFVTLNGDYRAKAVAKIVATARRGDTTVAVDRAADIAVGDTVLVVVREDAAQTLKTFLYNGDPGDIRRGKPLDTKMRARVVAIEGTRVRLDRALRFETRAEWTPELRSFHPTVTESGLEGLGFVFPAEKYRGHFKEHGFNAIELRNVADCWVRDVAIHNGDLGINIVACGNTVDGVVFTAQAGRGSREGPVEVTGHHAIQVKNAEDNLVTRFDLQTGYVHDLTVEHASGNAFTRGRGTDLCFDHHKDTPYENLFSDIDGGRGSRVWRCGGGASIGRQSAGWGVFWNIRAARPIEPPPVGWGAPTLSFVGLTTKTPTATAASAGGGWWWEAVPPERLEPRDLHAAQVARRAANATANAGR